MKQPLDAADAKPAVDTAARPGSATFTRAKSLSPESSFLNALAAGSIISDRKLECIAADAYARSHLLPWQSTLRALALALGVAVTPVEVQDSDAAMEDLEGIADNLLTDTKAHHSRPDACRLMMHLALPKPLLSLSQALGDPNPAALLHLPSWFLRAGFMRLGHSGLMPRLG